MRPPFTLRKDTPAKAKHLLTREEGASLVEYGVLLGFVVVGVIASLTLLGAGLQALFQGLVNQLAT